MKHKMNKKSKSQPKETIAQRVNFRRQKLDRPLLEGDVKVKEGEGLKKVNLK